MSGSAGAGVKKEHKNSNKDLILLSEPLCVVAVEANQRDVEEQRADVLNDCAAIGDDRGDADEAWSAVDGALCSDAWWVRGPAFLVSLDAALGDQSPEVGNKHLDVRQHRRGAAESDTYTLGHHVDGLVVVIEHDRVVMLEVVPHPDAKVGIDPVGLERQHGK